MTDGCRTNSGIALEDAIVIGIHLDLGQAGVDVLFDESVFLE